jgi:hypothetical protein
MSDETTARVERLRSALEHGCERWEIDDLLRDAIAAIDSYVLRLDTNEQERVNLASWFNEAEQMAGKLQRERDLALRRLDALTEVVQQTIIDWDGIDDWPTTREATEKNVRELSQLIRAVERQEIK